MIFWNFLLPCAAELHEHDRPLARVEVGARAGEPKVLAGELGRPVRVVRIRLEEVPRPARRSALAAGADDGVGSARDDDGLLRDAEDDVARLLRLCLGLRFRLGRGRRLQRARRPRRALERALRELELLRRLRREQRLLRGRRAGDHALVRLVEQVPLGRALLLHERLLAREQRVDVRVGNRLALRPDRLRRAREVGLEVVELELCRLPDQRCRRAGIVHAGELDHDLVRALLPDLGLGDAELVDAVPHDVLRDRHAARVDLLSLGRNRLEDDLEPALDVEALARRSMPGRAGHGHVNDTRDRGDDY